MCGLAKRGVDVGPSVVGPGPLLIDVHVALSTFLGPREFVCDGGEVLEGSATDNQGKNQNAKCRRKGKGAKGGVTLSLGPSVSLWLLICDF